MDLRAVQAGIVFLNSDFRYKLAVFMALFSLSLQDQGSEETNIV